MFGKSRRNHRVLILGPPAVGKTTIMYRLTQQPVPESMVPTATSVLEKNIIAPSGHKLTFAEQKYETDDASAIIFVISKPAFAEGIETVKHFLQSGLRREVPLLILVNKQDLDFEPNNEDSGRVDGSGSETESPAGSDEEHEAEAPPPPPNNKHQDDPIDQVCAELTPLVGTGRSWAVWRCSGKNNTGLDEVLQWLVTKLPLT